MEGVARLLTATRENSKMEGPIVFIIMLALCPILGANAKRNGTIFVLFIINIIVVILMTIACGMSSMASRYNFPSEGGWSDFYSRLMWYGIGSLLVSGLTFKYSK
jgi:hypothetical protein